MVKIAGGLKLENSTSYKEFGKFIINWKLLKDNILLIKYKSYAPFPSIRRTEISDDLKDLIINIFDTSEINYQLGKTLKESEKKILHTLITKSGLSEQLNYEPKRMTEDLEDIINDYNVLKGIIIAGNDNPDIISQIEVVLEKLVMHKKISKKNASDIIDEIKLIN